MKQCNLIRLQLLDLMLLSAISLTAMTASATLPKPIQVKGVVLAIDYDTQTLMFKQAKDKKPFVLDWNRDTQFIVDDREVAATELKDGMVITIYYKHVSFKNRLLKEVIGEHTAKEGTK